MGLIFFSQNIKIKGASIVEIGFKGKTHMRNVIFNIFKNSSQILILAWCLLNYMWIVISMHCFCALYIHTPELNLSPCNAVFKVLK